MPPGSDHPFTQIIIVTYNFLLIFFTFAQEHGQRITKTKNCFLPALHCQCRIQYKVVKSTFYFSKGIFKLIFIMVCPYGRPKTCLNKGIKSILKSAYRQNVFLTVLLKNFWSFYLDFFKMIILKQERITCLIFSFVLSCQFSWKQIL